MVFSLEDSDVENILTKSSLTMTRNQSDFLDSSLGKSYTYGIGNFDKANKSGQESSYIKAIKDTTKPSSDTTKTPLNTSLLAKTSTPPLRAPSPELPGISHGAAGVDLICPISRSLAYRRHFEHNYYLTDENREKLRKCFEDQEKYSLKYVYLQRKYIDPETKKEMVKRIRSVNVSLFNDTHDVGTQTPDDW